MSSILPVETQLVIRAACRPPGDPGVAELMSRDLDWNAVTTVAAREKLLPVVWHAVSAFPDRIPEESARTLRQVALVSEFGLSALEEILRECLTELQKAGIPVMLLKGAALAHTVHGSLLRRPMGDLDLHLRAEDAERGWSLFRERAWTLEFDDLEEFHADFHHLPPLVGPGRMKGILEIHRALWPAAAPFELSEEELWSAAQPVSVDGIEVRVPSVPHQLIHLSVHLVWSNLMERGLAKAARDVSALVEQDAPDWDELIRLARRARAGSCCYWSLRLARTLAGADVPGSVLDALRPPTPNVVLNVLERAFIASGLLRACPSLKVHAALWTAGVRPGASGHDRRSRPWAIGDRFRRFISAPPDAPLHERIVRHAHGLSSWVDFARMSLWPRRVM